MEQPVTIDVQGEKPGHLPPTKGFARPSLGGLLTAAVAFVGLAALGASVWTYSETQREIRRIATDIAQLRLSVELLGRQQGAPSSTDNASLTDIANRLSILEADWRRAPAQTAPATPAPVAATPADAGDCLPTGTRFMVAAGDRYPVCGTDAVVEIGSVDNGFISLADGTVIAQGGSIGLPNSACMIGVVPMDGGGISGYAEIRVTC